MNDYRFFTKKLLLIYANYKLTVHINKFTYKGKTYYSSPISAQTSGPKNGVWSFRFFS